MTAMGQRVCSSGRMAIQGRGLLAALAVLCPISASLAEPQTASPTQHPAKFAVAAGPNGPCAKDFGVATMPTSFLVDRNGAIRMRHAGFRPDDVAELRTKALLTEPAATGAK
jgi:hypothetical protein